MLHLAVKIALFEFEHGCRTIIDDWKVCLSTEDAKAFQVEWNLKNKDSFDEDWHMKVEGEPTTIYLTDEQFSDLESEKRCWLSELNGIYNDEDRRCWVLKLNGI
jgi:hypothetical protein